VALLPFPQASIRIVSVPCHIENSMSQVMDLRVNGMNICRVALHNNTLFYLANQSTLHSFHITVGRQRSTHHYSYMQFSHSPCVSVQCTAVIILQFSSLTLNKAWEMLYCRHVSYLTHLCTGHQNVVKLSKPTASD
jgi:hypothetical protein